MTSLDPNERPYIITLSLATYFPTALLFYTTDGAAMNFFPPPFTAAKFEPTSVELHQAGTFEGRSTRLSYSAAAEPSYKMAI